MVRKMNKKRKVIEKEGINVLEDTKEGFFALCKQYDHIGQLMKLQAKTLKHPMFDSSPAPVTLSRMLEQYNEIGEQLKMIGKGLDIMGGKSVQEDPEKKKKENEKEDKKDKEFVSNIEPDKKNDDKDKKK